MLTRVGLICAIILFATALYANPLVVDDMRGFTWKSRSFQVIDEVTCQVDAQGQIVDNRWMARGWIVDVAGHRLVWEMTRSDSRQSGRYGLRSARDEITLTPGYYRIYFGIDAGSEVRIEDFGDFLQGLFDGFEPHASPQWEEWYLSLDPEETSAVVSGAVQPLDPRVIVQMIGVGDHSMKRKMFHLDDDVYVRIFMMGEGIYRSNRMFDTGWILDLDSRTRVWEAQARRGKHAGGADKNWVFDERIRLSQGNYAVYYSTDGSHSAENFNRMPPYEPDQWGITVSVEDVEDMALISEYKEKDREPIVSIRRVRDDDFQHKGFELLQDMDVRVYALGEQSGSRTFVDKGWILKAHTFDVVWEMSGNNTTHAGGGRKNQMADERIHLPAGKYLMYYSTDDSHSFEEWNTEPPYDPEAWGITLYPAGDDFETDWVQPYSEDQDPSILGILTQPRDDDLLSSSFTLEEETPLSIYAIGEGDRYEMYDYGWIEDATGDVVWEMDYPHSRPAGGARKNRMFKGVIRLEKGSYTAYFQTDGSHSFSDWNASPPKDPYHYGMTLSIPDSE
jgi:hypothetical protein